MMMANRYIKWAYQSFDYNQMSLWYYLIQFPLYYFLLEAYYFQHF